MITPFVKFQNHIPARGRKPSAQRDRCTSRYAISKPHPRKGTETLGLSDVSRLSLKFQNHIPARGWKRNITIEECFLRIIFQNHIPARGRKLALNPLFHFFSSYFKTTSPQGDGNARAYCLSLLLALISKPHPRKGTETHSSSLPRASRGRGTAKRWKIICSDLTFANRGFTCRIEVESISGVTAYKRRPP